MTWLPQHIVKLRLLCTNGCVRSVPICCVTFNVTIALQRMHACECVCVWLSLCFWPDKIGPQYTQRIQIVVNNHFTWLIKQCGRYVSIFFRTNETIRCDNLRQTNDTGAPTKSHLYVIVLWPSDLLCRLCYTARVDSIYAARQIQHNDVEQWIVLEHTYGECQSQCRNIKRSNIGRNSCSSMKYVYQLLKYVYENMNIIIISRSVNVINRPSMQ